MTVGTTALLLGLVCLAVASAVQPLVIGVLRRASVLDVPGARSSHAVPTPRGGGLALLAGMLVTLGLAPVDGTAAAVLAVAAFGLIGLLDDLRDLSVSLRFLAQLAAGGVVAVLVLADATGPGPVLFLGGVLVTVWVCAFVNAFNFMDGINGISGAFALLGGASFAVLGVWAATPILVIGGTVVAAAGLAFLPWNAVRPKVFLGDVGSYALGAVLAVLGVLAVLAGVPLETAVAPLAVYLADTGWTLIRRIRAGENWRQAHRSHVYQRLCDLGWSHGQVTVVTTAAGAVVTLCAAAALTGQWPLRALGDVLACLVLLGYLLSPSYLAARVRVGSGAT